MPTYTFKNRDTGEVVDMFMSITERDVFLEWGGPWLPVPTCAAIVDPVWLGIQKPDQQFRERMSHIKEHHSRGVTQSTIRER